MSLLQRLYITAAAGFILAVSYANAAELDAPEVDPNCLGCLCEAATQCNATTACHVPYAGAYFCGPFHLSWAYWADAGKPVIQHDDPARKGAFENCAQDLYCAAQVVRQYMKKFASNPKKVDCNGDGKIDCIDYAHMHWLGGYSCNKPSFRNTDFYKRFNTCWRVVVAAQPHETTTEPSTNTTTS